MTAPFCGACDRLRLTADGQFRNCLFSLTEYDVTSAVRGMPVAAAPDDRRRVIAETLHACVLGKLPGHAINDPSFLQPARGMNAIGG